MQPFNYQLQIRDPFESALSGLKLGVAERGVEEQRQQAALAQQAMQQNMERQRQLNSRIDTMIQGGLRNTTAEDFAAIRLLSDEKKSAQAGETFAMLDKAAQRETIQRGGALLSAIKNKQIPAAQQMLNDRETALRNSGRPQDQAEIASIVKHKELLKTNPDAVEFEFSVGLASLGEDGQKTLDNILKAQQAPVDLKKKNEEVRKFGVDINLTEAQIKKVQAETKKLGTEQQKAILELKALEETGGVDPAKMFDKEAKIRNEYQKRTGKYQELKGTFQNINSSAEAQTGPGDIALITSFMKMLDPGSVVRETEFATARDTAGLYAQLVNNLQKAKDGKFLNPKQRGEYVSLSRQYLNAAEKQAKQEENNLRVVVKNYKLNPENIFGAGSESVVVKGVTYERPAGFTDEQWIQYKRSQGAQ